MLTTNPNAVLKAAAAHFGISVVSALAQNHSAFAVHSKLGGSFTKTDRNAEHQMARQAYGEEIELVLAWANAVAQTANITLTLPNPLSL
jgi:hypothetical protein